MIPYKEALEIAERVKSQLDPHCVRCEIAGSIRRKKPFVKDIEIVAIPKSFDIGLCTHGLTPVVNQWPVIKGQLTNKTKYTQRMLPEGIKLDLFFATVYNWGLIFAIRTGSADFSHYTLARGWVRKGYKSVDGYLTKDEKRYAVYEEEELFKLIGKPFIDPEDRI